MCAAAQTYKYMGTKTCRTALEFPLDTDYAAADKGKQHAYQNGKPAHFTDKIKT